MKYVEHCFSDIGNREQLALSAVSWPGLGFPGSGMKTASSVSSPAAFFAFFASFSSNVFA